MPSKLSLVALGAGAYIALTIARFPAVAAYRWFVPQTVQLAGITGTVWSGAAAFGSVGGLTVADLSWDLRAPSLLLGRADVGFQARFADGFINGDLVATAGGEIRLTDLAGATTLQNLSTVLPLYSTEGQVSLSLDSLVIANDWPVAASGELRVAELAVAALIPTSTADMVPLGSFSARFTETSEPGIVALLSDLGGPLELQGSFRLNVDRSYALEGLVRPRPDASEMLLQGLGFMTEEPDSEGRRAFTMTGSLRAP